MVRPPKLRTMVVWGIFFVQATLAILFFWNLGVGAVDRVILAATGVCLELAKRYCWSAGRTPGQRWVLNGLAVVFSVISGLSAVSYSWSATQAGVDRAVQQESDINQVEDQLRALASERDAIQVKLDALPADWVTLSLRFSTRLEQISQDQKGLQQRLGELGGLGQGGEGGVKSGFVYLRNWAESIGLAWQVYALGFLVLVSILLETAVAITSFEGRTSTISGPDSIERLIIKTAFREPGKPLLSRRKIASAVKVSEAQVRKVMEWLTASALASCRPGTKGLYACVPLEECLHHWSRRDTAER